MPKLVRARAPLRLGLAGGGSDVSPFCDQFGGAVINATIDRYAFASCEVGGEEIILHAADIRQFERHPVSNALDASEGLRLHRGVYNRMIRDFHDSRPLPMRLVTQVDSPLGSGLGSSSALVVAMVKLLAEVLGAPLGEYEIARLAFDIERNDLGLHGGRQDQYAAAFGGFNFMEFGSDERVIVNPLRMRSDIVRELECSLVLFFTGVSRRSAEVIESQRASVVVGGKTLEAMLRLKEEAVAMKEALLFGSIRNIAEVLERGWAAKKETSSAVSSPLIETVYKKALDAGAMAGKVSGAGGGGFMMFIVDPLRRDEVIFTLKEGADSMVMPARFTTEGSHTWRVN